MNTGPSDDDAMASLMASMLPEGGKDPEEDEGDEGPEEDDEGGEELPEDADDADEDEGDDEGDEGDEEDGEDDEDGEDEANSQAAAVADDAVVSVVVDGQAQDFTVGQLKRLAGQEASLTRKSQEADLVGQRAASVLQGSLGLIMEDLEPYKNVDWVLEGQRMDPEEFEWHRSNYNRLQGRYEQLVGAAQQLGEQAEERHNSSLKEQAVEAVKVLSDPTNGIQGFGPEMYQDIVKFAVDAGLPEDDVSQIVNPNVLKIINDARLYRQAKKATGKKVSMAPKRVRKQGGSEAIQEGGKRSQKRLERKVLSGQGSDDDAQALLLGRWGLKG